MTQLDTKASFTYLILPFVFAPGDFEKRLKWLDGLAWHNPKKDSDIRLWARDRFDSEDLLPHVADYINPGMGTLPTVAVLHLNGDARTALWGNPSQSRWQLEELPGRPDIPFLVTDTHVYLFRTGAGFAVVTTQLCEGATLDDLLDFNHFARTFDSRSRGRLVFRRRTGPESWEETHPAMLTDNTVGEQRVYLGELLDKVIDPQAERWTRNILNRDQMLAFCGLAATGFDSPDPAAAPPQSELLEKLRSFGRAGFSAVESRTTEGLIQQYARGIYWTFSMNGGVWASLDAPEPFGTQALAGIVRKGYLPLFLLAQHQRLVLLELSRKVAQEFIPPETERADPGFEAKVTALRKQVWEFTWRAHFSHVSHNDRRQAYYARWREVLGVEGLYGEVNDRIREVGDLLNAHHDSEQLERMRQNSVQLHETMRHQLATSEALEIVEVAIAGVYLLEGLKILFENSGYQTKLVEQASPWLGLAPPFWFFLFIVLLTFPLLRWAIERHKQKLFSRGSQTGVDHVAGEPKR